MRYLALLSLCGLALAAPSGSSHVVHEKRDIVPGGWWKGERVNRQLALPVRIGLAQSNLDKGDEMLMSVSDPASPNYGKHWTAEDVRDFFAPSAETVDSVKEWLTSSGVEAHRISHSFNKGWLEFKASAAELEELLKAKYHYYEHEATGTRYAACDEYSVPEHLLEHIDIVSPTLHFDVPLKGRPGASEHAEGLGLRKRTGIPGHVGGPHIGRTIGSASALQGMNPSLGLCDTIITPPCLRYLYNLPNATHNLSSYGIVEYAPETYLQSDLDLFQSVPTILNDNNVPRGAAPKFEGIDGGFLEPSSDESFNINGEPDLDLEYAQILVYPQQITLYQVGDNGTNSEYISFNNFLDGIDGSYCTYDGGDDPNVDEPFPDPGKGGYHKKEQCGVWKPTDVISTSYAYNEHDLTPKYEQRQCHEYMKLGMQGVTFVYSSGDYGVAGNLGECIDPKTGGYTNGTYGKFNPSFPGTCPYVTVVGATQVIPGTDVTTTTHAEQACETVIYSGGGFSNVFPLPSWQSSAVGTYFADHKPTYGANRYNNSMKTRGIPDVAANGANYVIALDGEFTLVYGTSASAPTFGSVITFLNNARAANGKGPLGFLNPSFYGNPGMFNDITNGTNQGCGTAGFSAVKGWDPVTGLGTPNYKKMAAVLLNQ